MIRWIKSLFIKGETMKKTTVISLILSVFLFSINSFAATRNIQDNYQVIYNVIDTAGDPVGSETVALSIKKTSNGYWYDFSDNSFKNSGWTNKTTNLTEDSTNGLYYYTFDPPSSETAADEYIFCVDNASATYGDHQCEVVTYQNIGTGTSTHSAADVATAVLATPASKLATDASGRVTVGTNADKTGYTASTVSDKTGYSLTQTFPTNFSSLAITAGGAVTAGTVSDKTGYTASTVSDKTGYSLTQTFPANFSALSISATTGLVDITQTAADKVWGTAARAITGLTAAALSDFFDTSSGTNYAAAIAGSVVKEIADNAGGSSLSESGIADAVWNEAQSGHVTPGSFGYYLDSTVSTAGGGSLTAADIWAYGTRTLTAGTYTGLSSADVDLIWNELMSGHTTLGSFGKTMSNINDATDGDKEGSVYTGIENLIRRHGQ